MTSELSNSKTSALILYYIFLTEIMSPPYDWRAKNLMLSVTNICLSFLTEIMSPPMTGRLTNLLLSVTNICLSFLTEIMSPPYDWQANKSIAECSKHMLVISYRNHVSSL